MKKNDIKRLPRLIAILTQLQAKRLLTSTELAQRHAVSVRTIYRDIKALEEAGVPILTEDGKGYSLIESYRIPPVMFTESEANALITVEQLILESNDATLIREFSEVASKVKAILKHSVKDKVALLEERILIRRNENQDISSSHLSVVQLAITNSQVAQIDYLDELQNITSRVIEPFALYGGIEKWVLFAYCRLRGDFRAFRLDRIKSLKVQDEKFQPHTLTFAQFLAKYYNTPDI